MNQEEQRALAIECKADENADIGWGVTFEFGIDELAAYTAAVEAKERERCATVCENLTLFAHEQPFYDEAAAVIRSLK